MTLRLTFVLPEEIGSVKVAYRGGPSQIPVQTKFIPDC
jgi:hypothetical protein